MGLRLFLAQPHSYFSEVNCKGIFIVTKLLTVQILPGDY
jgi:hypothetical protein